MDGDSAAGRERKQSRHSILRPEASVNVVEGNLQRVETDKLRGFWHDSMLLARGGVLQAAGRHDEALAVYESLLTGESGDPRLRPVAERRIGLLKAK